MVRERGPVCALGRCADVRPLQSPHRGCRYRVDDCLPPRDTSQHQDSTGTTPSSTPPPSQPPPPPQTRGTQSHSAPTPLKRPMLTPEGGPGPAIVSRNRKIQIENRDTWVGERERGGPFMRKGDSPIPIRLRRCHAAAGMYVCTLLFL